MPTEEEIEAGIEALRKMLDDSGYGSWVTDAQCKQGVIAVLEAAEAVRDE